MSDQSISEILANWNQSFEGVIAFKQAIAAFNKLAERASAAFKEVDEKLQQFSDVICEAFHVESVKALMTIEELWEEIQDAMLFDDSQTMPPREYGEKLIRKKERFRKHASYNYIPQVHRNLPYMRRRYS